jgi:hypothetical protein
MVYATAGPCGSMQIKESAVDFEVLAPIVLAIVIIFSKRWL